VVWNTIYLIGAIQGLFLAVLLFSSRYERWQGNVFLGFLALIISVLLSLFAARLIWQADIPSFLFWPLTALPTLIGPCLYFYLQSILTGIRRFVGKDCLHLLPFIIVVVAYLPETLTSPSAGLIHLDEPMTIKKTLILSYLKSIQLLIYLIISFSLLGKDHTKNNLQESARLFLRKLVTAFIALSLVGMLLSTLYSFDVYKLPLADKLELTFLATLTYFLAYYVFVYDVRPSQPKKRYLSSALTESARNELAIQISQYMEKEFPYLQDEFKAASMASNLGISEHYLSEVLALELNTNFYSLTNRYRLDHFKQLVINPIYASKPTIDIALAAGFNSKSSFHRVVKEAKGITPGAYRKLLQHQ